MQSGMTYGLCIVVTGGCVCVCCACGGLVSYLAVSFVFVKKLSCRVFLIVRLALMPLCGIMLRCR